jgi:hypothetical protein
LAGFSKLFVIGGRGGFDVADEVNPIQLQIWVGDSDRQWLEPHYVDVTIKPIGTLRSLVPEGPNHPNSLIDACIAFFPKHFRECPSLTEAVEQLRRVSRLDFDKHNVPSVWQKLREEARPFFDRLNIFEADLKLIAKPSRES